MNGIMEFIKVNAKSIVAFLIGILFNAIQQVISGQAPWPSSLAEWGKYLGTSLVLGIGVWATGNKLTVDQITKSAVQQGVTVITNQTIDQVANAAESAVKQATDGLPPVVAKPVNDVAQQVSDTVTTVLKGVADNIPFKPIDIKNVL